MGGVFSEFSSIVVGAFVGAVVGELVSRGSSAVTNFHSNQTGTDEKLQRLRLLVLKFHSIAEEALGRQITNQRLLELVKLFMDTAYQGEYVLDTFRYKGLLRDKARQSANRTFSLSPFNPAKRIRMIAKNATGMLSGDKQVLQLNSILEKLEIIKPEVAEFLKLLKCCHPTIRSVRCYLYLEENKVFGRHFEKEHIVNLLLQSTSDISSRVDVLPIIGKRGVGKTTLSICVCNHPRVHEHFSLIVYFKDTPIKEDQDVISIAKKILDQSLASYSTSDAENLDTMLSILKQKLNSERLLLILDDARCENTELWKVFIHTLTCGVGGSKVLATGSSKEDVASIGTVCPFQLKGFHKEEYWFFFKEHAFGTENPELHPRLALTGREIARRLHGSPLAAKIVADQLRDKLTVKHWRRALKTITQHCNGTKGSITSVYKFTLNLLSEGAQLRNANVEHHLAGDAMSLTGFKDMLSSGDTVTLNHSAREIKVVMSKTRFPCHSMYYTATLEMI